MTSRQASYAKTEMATLAPTRRKPVKTGNHNGCMATQHDQGSMSYEE